MLSSTWISELINKLSSHTKKIHMSHLTFSEEVQCVLADFTKTAEDSDGYRYVFCAIDIFSRYVGAIAPRQTK